MRKTYLLIPENPLVLLPSLAKMIGLNEAVIAQQLFFLLSIPDAGLEREGHKWIFNTYEQWQEKYFPFWSVDTIMRVFQRLETMHIIESCQPDGRQSRRKYYRLNSGMIEKLTLENSDTDKLSVSAPDTDKLSGWETDKVSASILDRDYTETTNRDQSELSFTEQYRKSPEANLQKELNNPKFLKSWDNWCEFKRERKATLTKSQKAMTLVKLAEWTKKYGIEKVIEQIDEAIIRNYRKIFEPKLNGNSYNQPSKPLTSIQIEPAKFLAWQKTTFPDRTFYETPETAPLNMIEQFQEESKA